MSVAVLLIISACLPLISFAILAFVGKRMGNPLAGMVGTFFVAGSFVAGLVAMIVWLSLDTAEGRAYGFGGQPYRAEFNWVPVTPWLASGGIPPPGRYVHHPTLVMV